MTYFAKVDENDVVIQVLRAEQWVIDTGDFGDPKDWIETHYEF